MVVEGRYEKVGEENHQTALCVKLSKNILVTGTEKTFSHTFTSHLTFSSAHAIIFPANRKPIFITHFSGYLTKKTYRRAK